MQLLCDSTEEGNSKCLGVIPIVVKKFNRKDLKVPHMGWNEVVHTRSHALWEGIDDGSRFYFVHSYYVQPRDSAIVQATSDYPQPFVCAAARDNLFAVQFHPEKSAAAGLKLLQNFINWNPL